MTDPYDFPPAMHPVHEPEPVRLAPDEFLSRDALDALAANGEIHLAGALARTRDGERYVLRDALRVLGKVSPETDPYGFIGHTDTLASFLRRGFVMSAERIALGRSVYDVEYGYLAQRVGGDADRSGTHTAL